MWRLDFELKLGLVFLTAYQTQWHSWLVGKVFQLSTALPDLRNLKTWATYKRKIIIIFSSETLLSILLFLMRGKHKM